MLVSHHLGLFFLVHPTTWKEINLSFRDGKDSINSYLLNLILEFFASLHCVCLLLLHVHATIKNLAYPNPHNPQLTG